MIPFREYRKDCMFRNDLLCSYWKKSTECHLLSCPFYSKDISTKSKSSLEIRMKDTITFSPDDLDIGADTVQDIILRSREEGRDSKNDDESKSHQSLVTEKLVSRLTCIACGEQIYDDKFTTIRDPKGVVIYLHSKGKCEVRHEGLAIVRERWLKMYNYAKKLSQSEDF